MGEDYAAWWQTRGVTDEHDARYDGDTPAELTELVARCQRELARGREMLGAADEAVKSCRERGFPRY
jgi:hypothetical protein